MNILIDLEGITCKDKSHTFSLANVELIIPGEDFVRVTLPVGTELKLATPRPCPVCKGKVLSITLDEEWVIDWDFGDEIEPMSDEEIDAIEAEAEANPGPAISPERDQRQRAFVQQLALGISTEMRRRNDTLS